MFHFYTPLKTSEKLWFLRFSGDTEMEHRCVNMNGSFELPLNTFDNFSGEKCNMKIGGIIGIPRIQNMLLIYQNDFLGRGPSDLVLVI